VFLCKQTERLNPQKSLSLPTADDVIECFSALFEKDIEDLDSKEVDVVTWVVTKVMPCVSLFQWKPYAKTKAGESAAGRFCQNTSVSDLAAVCWLLTHYRTPKSTAEVKAEAEQDNKKTNKREYKKKVDNKVATMDYITHKEAFKEMFRRKKTGQPDDVVDRRQKIDNNIALLINDVIKRNSVMVYMMMDDNENDEQMLSHVSLDKAVGGVDSDTWQDFS
jgi:hypothetical protein